MAGVPAPTPSTTIEDGEQYEHEFRTLIAGGRVSVPAWIDRDAVDGLLGAHVDGSPRHRALKNRTASHFILI